MLYALWTIAGLLAMILGVLIVMRREYASALSTLYSGLNQLCQTVEQNRIATEFELRRQTNKNLVAAGGVARGWLRVRIRFAPATSLLRTRLHLLYQETKYLRKS
jgi:hypothetical protein